MRKLSDIHLAHDAVLAVLNDEIKVTMDQVTRNSLTTMLGTLCWVLEHNKRIDHLVEMIEQIANEQGLERVTVGKFRQDAHNN